MEGKRIATPVDWLFSPDWLTFEQACFLSGWDEDTMREIVDEGGVDLNLEGLIEKRGNLTDFGEHIAEMMLLKPCRIEHHGFVALDRFSYEFDLARELVGELEIIGKLGEFGAAIEAGDSECKSRRRRGEADAKINLIDTNSIL